MVGVALLIAALLPAAAAAPRIAALSLPHQGFLPCFKSVGRAAGPTVGPAGVMLAE